MIIMRKGSNRTADNNFSNTMQNSKFAENLDIHEIVHFIKGLYYVGRYFIFVSFKEIGSLDWTENYRDSEQCLCQSTLVI